MLTETREGIRQYLTILSDGKFHKSVPEGTEGAVIREYEDKAGVKQTKTELVFDSVTGKITDVSFEDSDYGKNLKIELDGDGIISVGTSSSFGEDLMKKLPNIKLEQEVKLVPYSFTTGSKNKKGVTVYQNEEKVENFYYNGATKENINGIPVAEGDTTIFDSDDWKMHFMKIRKFLILEVEKLIESNFNGL